MDINFVNVNSENLLHHGGRKRDDSIDILKGLAIILVVYGHTWPFCRQFIYLFHMPVFLMASGFCYKSRITTLSELRKYIFKKLFKLYLPFIICNLFFVLLEPIFIKFGIYTNNTEFLVLTRDWPLEQKITTASTIWIVIRKLIKVLLFIGTTRLSGSSWFLTELFIIVIVHSTLIFLLSKKSNIQKYVIFFVILFLIVLSQFISITNPSLLYPVKTFPCTYLAFLYGFLIRKIKKIDCLYSWWMGIIAFFSLICLSYYCDIEVSAGRIGNVLIYSITSMLGWIFLKVLSNYLIKCNLLKKILIYLGQHTMPILLLHVACFKIVTLLIICIYKLPVLYLAAHMVIFDVGELWKFIYTVVGVIVPIILFYFYQKIFNLLIIRS